MTHGVTAFMLTAAAITLSGVAAAGVAEMAEPCERAAECVVHSAETGGELSSLLQSQELKQDPPSQSLLARTAAMGITEIQENYIVINGRGYSRYAAHSALLGRLGSEFSDTAFIPPRLSLTDNPQDAWMENNVIFGTSVWIESSQEKQFDIDLATNAIPAVDIEAGLQFNHSHNGEFYLKLMSFGSYFTLQQAMNTDQFKAFRNYIKKHMDRPRIVTGVWILIEGDAELSNFCAAGSLKLSAEKIGSITVSGSGCRMSTWQFTPDSVMAYETARIKFDKAGKVTELETDRAR